MPLFRMQANSPPQSHEEKHKPLKAPIHPPRDPRHAAHTHSSQSFGLERL